MRLTVILAGLFVTISATTFAVRAQDVPGIEICTAEKTMERRTSCLQSNVNFLKAAMTKAQLDSQQRIDAAIRQIDALKSTVTGLVKTIDDLKSQIVALEKKKDPAAK